MADSTFLTSKRGCNAAASTRLQPSLQAVRACENDRWNWLRSGFGPIHIAMTGEPYIPNPAPRRGWHETVVAGLFLLVCTYSLNGFRPWWTPITLTDANTGSVVRQVIYAGSACLCLLLLWIRSSFWTMVREQLPIVFVGAWLVLTAAYSDAPSLTIKRSILFICGACVLLGIVTLSARPLHRAVLLLAVVSGIAASVSLLWWAAFPPEITTNPGRPGLAGISNHPNTLAPALAIGLVAAIALDARGRLWSTARLVSVASCVLALLMTASITSIMTGAIMFGTYIALMATAYWRAVGVLIAFGTIVAVALIGPSQIAAEALSGVNRDTSLSGRDELWGLIFDQIRQAPLFGHGWGAFWTEGKGRELVTTWNPRQSHNAYMDLVLDLGIIGAALMLFALLRPIACLWSIVRKRSNPDRRLAAAGLSIAVGFLTVYALQQSFLGKVDSYAFVAILLIAAAASRTIITKPPPDPDGSAHSTLTEPI